MKRFIAFGFSLSAVLLCQPAGAAEPVYCPQEVNCAHSGPATACTFQQHERGYWNDPVASGSQADVLAGSYRLSYVSASYQSRGPSYPICVYTHTDVYNTLSILGKPESNLERYDAPDWRAEEFWWECKPHSGESCPLFEQAAVYIQNKRQYPIMVMPGKLTLKTGKYTRLFAEDFDDCATLDACWVEVYTQDEQIGAIIVDLNDDLKIIDIKDNIDVRSEIIRVGDYNAVEVR